MRKIEDNGKINRVKLSNFNHTTKSAGSIAGGGGSNLPTQKCSMPVQATITPIWMEIIAFRHSQSKLAHLQLKKNSLGRGFHSQIGH